MKKHATLISSAIALFALLSCVTIEEPRGFALLDAVEHSAKMLAEELSTGTRVAIIAFETESEALSDFIMEELTGALIDLNIEVADRRNLEFVFSELNFQMTGYVSDETAKSVGQFLGAELVITGQLRDIGSVRRFTVNAVNVETAIHVSSPRIDVRNDRALQDMIAALDRQQIVVRTVRHTIPEHTVPQTAGTYFDRGILFFNRGDLEIAIMDLTQAIRLNPSFASAYFYRGFAHSKRGEYTRAIADYTQAILLNPNHVGALNNRGIAHSSRGEHCLAIADYTEAIQRAPHFVYAHFNRGLEHYRIREYHLAIADYTQVIRLNPQHVSAHVNRGFVYSLIGEFTLAIADFNEAIRLNPEHPGAHFNRGVAHYNRGEFALAIKNYTQALRLAPNHVNSYINRGIAHFRIRQFDRAIADYEAALRINPNHPHARDYLEIARRHSIEPIDTR